MVLMFAYQFRLSQKMNFLYYSIAYHKSWKKDTVKLKTNIVKNGQVNMGFCQNLEFKDACSQNYESSSLHSQT